jgi:predicted amidophosphoribosyltransferase
MKPCVACNRLIPDNAVFCPECGANQGWGQQEIVTGAEPPGTPGATATDIRRCPYCRAAVSTIATACTNCFRPLQPTVAVSGFELKPPSRAMVWFLMGSAVVLVIGYYLFLALTAILSH